MRLRLVINRNGLPQMKIWWDTSTFQPGEDKTVSSLLTRVSQIVPLESSGWGLEDYAVEIDGFEVLHFQEVESVIREADEVVIRPLSGTEIKQRRLSGRRQISTSGRKLIDGTPFGRSFLRPAPDRPNLAIPPRKRRRIGQAEADDSITVEVGSETDDSYSDGGEDESDDANSEESAEVTDRRLDPAKKISGTNYEERDEEVEEGGEYDNPLMDYYYDEAGGQESKYGAETSEKIIGGSDSCSEEEGGSGVGNKGGSKDEEGIQKEAGHSPTTILGADIALSDSSEDEDFDPDAFQSDGSESDGKEEEQELVVENPRPVTIFGMGIDLSDQSDDEDFDPRKVVLGIESSDDDEESESGYTGQDTSSSEGEEEEEEEGSGSEEESEEEVVFRPKSYTQTRKLENRKTSVHARSSSYSSPASSSSSSKSPELQQAPLPKGPPVVLGTLPNQGKKATKARNQRKNENKKLRKLKLAGVLPKDTDHAGYLAYVAGQQTNTPLEEQPEPPKQLEPEEQAEQVKSYTGPEKPRNDGVAKLSKRRKRYKKAFNKARKAGKVPAGQDFEKWIREREQKRNVNNEKDSESDTAINYTNKHIEQTSTTTQEAFDDAPTEESSKKRKTPGRPSVNMDVVKRIVSHDLGVSKKKAVAAEEELMRKEWAQTHRKDTTNKRKGFAEEQYGKRPKKIIYDDDGNPVSVNVGNALEADAELKDPEVWKEKIVLTAVECEWEGAELPAPDFPFKQPPPLKVDVAGQKRKRGGGKRRKKQQEEYWGDESYGYGLENGYYQQQQNDDWNNYDYYDDTTNANGDQANDTVMEESKPVDDLPPLPNDITSLSLLTKPILPQTVIAFKQLTMDVNYAPILANYRTAVVEGVDEGGPDGPLLFLKLALRDRLERKVDKETGEKVLRKFEMPGDEDDDEGRLELMFGELIEPKIVKLPEVVEATSIEDEKADGNDSGSAMDDGVDTAGGEEAIDDAPQEEQQDEASSDKGSGEPTSGQGGFRTAVGSVAAVEEEVAAEEITSPNSSPSGELVSKNLQERATNLRLGTPVGSQTALGTYSPVYLQSYSEFKTPEAEAQLEVLMVDEDHHQPPVTNDDEEAYPTSQPAYESDSDGLPTLESILASQSQRISIKRESQANDEPQLPPLPQFSPFGMKVSDDTGVSPGGGKPLDEQQIQQEVEGAKSKPGRGRPKKPALKSSQVQIIDLTVTSDPPGEESPKTGGGRGRRVRGESESQWRAVKN